jgi:hypothetical protein
MNKQPMMFRMAIAITATAACLAAHAQNPPTSNPTTPAPAVTPSSPAPQLSFSANEVLKMYKGGINKDIIVNYINSTSVPYHLSADGIIYLQSLGIPQDVTKAMIVRDGQLQQQQAPIQTSMQPPYGDPSYAQPPYGQPPYGYPPQAAPAPTAPPAPDASAMVQPPQVLATPSSPAPDVTVIGGGYPYYYNYGYPYYGYGGPYYGWPVVVGGWGWGWGGGYRGGYRGGWGGYHGGGGFHGGGGHH